jgi:hypothetical protein
LEPSPYYSSPKDGIYIKKQSEGQKNEDSDRLLVYVLGDEIPDNPRLCDFLQQMNVSNLVLCGTFQDIVSLRKYFRDRPFTIVSEVGQYTSDPSSYDRVLILPIDVFSYSEPGSETKHLEKIRLESKKLLQL